MSVDLDEVTQIVVDVESVDKNCFMKRITLIRQYINDSCNLIY